MRFRCTYLPHRQVGMSHEASFGEATFPSGTLLQRSLPSEGPGEPSALMHLTGM